MIRLNLDENGHPYLHVFANPSYDGDLEDTILNLFILKALRYGVEVVGKPSLDKERIMDIKIKEDQCILNEPVSLCEPPGLTLHLPNGVSITTSGFVWRKELSGCPSNYIENIIGSANLSVMICCQDESWERRINKKYGSEGATIHALTLERWFELLNECLRRVK